MFMVILFAALSVVAVASTIVNLRTDGYRRIPTDHTRLPGKTAGQRAATTRS